MTPALAIWTPEDGLLGALAPLGLALAAGSALVIDLDRGGPRYPGERSLADMVETGPRRRDLQPRPGVAVLRNGGVEPARAAPVVEALLAAHPRVVLRLPPRPEPVGVPMPVVPVRLLLPGSLFPLPEQPAVFQATPAWVRLPAPGVRLPVPRVTTVTALISGRRPAGSDPWVSAWHSAWSFPWTR
ncbi:MAG: hypothetical protein QY307_05150 [Acidimicrobiia bacterium]|nr:MAG: hypothetical protein QY307_05150 [Acidimicrobiia bacterium]